MTRLTAKEIFRLSAVPFLLLLSLVVFIALYKFFNLPSSNELIKISEMYFMRYGYLIVFIAAFIETIPPINFYLPGSAVVVLSVAFTRDSTLNVFCVLAVAMSAFLFAYILDYLIGKWGWYWFLERCGFKSSLDQWKDKISSRGPVWLWWAYVHPNIGAIAATSCGTLKMSFKSFLAHSVGALLIWVSLWGTLAFFFGLEMLKFLDMRWLALVASLWFVSTLSKRLRERKKQRNL
jgi:membrane protein DedA with SNARE-associated domain